MKTAVAPDRATPTAAPADHQELTELATKTVAELSAQMMVRRQLDTAQSLLSGAREDLEAAKARVGMLMPAVRDEEEGKIVLALPGDTRKVVGELALGPDSAGVLKATQRVEQLERDVLVLEPQVWPDDQAALESALEVAEQREARSAAQLGGAIIRLEEERARRREGVAESEALLAAARRELADLEDRQVRRGEKVDVARAEARISELERQLRARMTVWTRTVDETRLELQGLRGALPIAETREAEEAEAAARAERTRKITALLGRQARALAEYSNVQPALEAEAGVPLIAQELNRAIGLFATHAAGYGIRLVQRAPHVWHLVEDE